MVVAAGKDFQRPTTSKWRDWEKGRNSFPSLISIVGSRQEGEQQDL